MRGLLVVIALAVGLLLLALLGIPILAERVYGPAAAQLGMIQRMEYSVRLLWADGMLTKPLDPAAPEIDFQVQPGESVTSICLRLQDAGIVGDASMLRDYLIYTGLDTTIQAGQYRLSGAMTIVDVATRMQDSTPSEVKFVILPGWRIEEIAAALPTSGLEISPEDFIAAAVAPRTGYDFLIGAKTVEGFLYPDTYVLARVTSTERLIDVLVHSFALHLTDDLREGFTRQGLSVPQAVTLGSIVQREAVNVDEAPLIASVYLNRLRAGMRMNADPTVQYALGFDAARATWWTNPLSLEDLKVNSPYNTYIVDGLPPAPISNPGVDALRAVASPAESLYYYFNARCDGSGYHEFSATFQEHLETLCP